MANNLQTEPAADVDLAPAAGRGRVAAGIAWRSHIRRYGLWIALGALIVFFCIASDSFRSTTNLKNILNQQAIIGVVACGMLVMMISGGFDLSVGAAGGAVGVLAAYVSQHDGLVLGILAALALGVSIGMVNGFLVTKARVNPFIATFAIASVIAGALAAATEGQSVVGEPGFLANLPFNEVLGIPALFVIFLGVAGLTHLILSRTKWGHWLFSVGANADASYLSGVPVTATKIAAFMFGGLTVGVAGLLLFGQSSIGQPIGANSWPLDAIAICIIGGTSLAGGVGRVADVAVAAVLLGVVSNGLNSLSVSTYWQPAVTGCVILIAVIAGGFTTRSGQGA